LPTLSELVAEGLYKAGHTHPSSDLTSRAENKWMEEIKADIWNRAKRQKFLQARSCQPLTKGLGIYSNPSDFASDMSMQFATGSRWGQLQAGAVGSLTLSSSEYASDTDILGKEIAITSGSGSGGIAYITNYNSSTKVATISPSLSVAPTVGDYYVILDYYKPVEEKPGWEIRNLNNPSQTGYPEVFYPQGDSTNGKFVLFPVPYRSDSQPLVVIQSYYADLTELDLSGTLMATLYQKWRNLWITGIKYKALEDADDTEKTSARTEYAHEVQKIIRQSYGNDIVNNAVRVMDYGV